MRSSIGWLCSLGVSVSLLGIHPHTGLEPYEGDEIIVHLIAHTHDDTGWKWTVDQYYIERVQWIFETMTRSLEENEDHKFTYVEMAYFYRWWNEQDQNTKDKVLSIIKENQLQMNLGGWCMNDEANPSISAMIRQMTDGNQFILDEFGRDALPKVGWHVDPFGHSYVTGGVLAQIGFDAFSFARINTYLQNTRMMNQNMEFIWKGSSSGDSAENWIFTHILDHHYCSPSGIKFFEESGTPDYLGWDKKLPTYPFTLISTAEDFITTARERVDYFQHNRILIPWGCDFKFMNAFFSFVQMDHLIDYIHSNSTYNATVIYSTLEDYVNDIHSLNLEWELETVDLFNYINNANTWWTGYFSSRPWLKQYTRSRESVLRTAELLYSFYSIDNNKSEALYQNLTQLRRAVDVAQHHDAITGTETDEVSLDYGYMLGNGTVAATLATQSLLSGFLTGNEDISDDPSKRVVFSFNDLDSLDYNTQYLPLVVYNNLGWKVRSLIQIPSNRSDIVILDGNTRMQLEYQQLTENPYGYDVTSFGEQSSQYSLYFIADLLPLGYTTFFIHILSAHSPMKSVIAKQLNEKIMADNNDFKLGSNGVYTVTVDGDSKLLKQVTNHDLQESFSFSNKMTELRPSGGYYYDGSRISGAYIFRPAQDCKYSLQQNDEKVTVPFWRPFESSGNVISPNAMITGSISFSNGIYSAGVCGMNSNSFSFKSTRLTDGGVPNPIIYPGEKMEFVYFPTDLASSGQSFYDEGKHYELTNKYFGSYSAGSIADLTASNNYRLITLNFPTKYNFIPTMISSVRTLDCDSSTSTGQLITIMKSISSSQASFYLVRMDGKQSSENVMIDYILYDPNEGSNTAGVFQAFDRKQWRMSDELGYQSTEYDWSDFHPSLHEATVFYQLSIEDDSVQLSEFPRFYVGLQNVSWKNFSFSALVNDFPSNIGGSGLDFYIDFWLFERPLINDVNAGEERGGALTVSATDLQSGPLFDQYTQVFRDGYSQTLQVFNEDFGDDLRYLDLAMHVGPLNTNGSELLASFYSTDFSNARSDTDDLASMDTCQYGLEFIERPYSTKLDERIAGNTYPSASQIRTSLSQTDAQFSVIANLAHGSFIAPIDVTNPVNNAEDGRSAELHLLLHRCDLEDDGFGVNEVLNYSSHIEADLRLSLDSSYQNAYLNHRLYVTQLYPPSLFYGKPIDSINEWTQKYHLNDSVLIKELPMQIHLSSLKYAYDNGQFAILQMRHLFEESDPSPLSDTVTMTDMMDGWFKSDSLKMNKLTEMQLTGTLPLNQVERKSWLIKDPHTGLANKVDFNIKPKYNESTDTVTLNARQFVTLLVNANP